MNSKQIDVNKKFGLDVLCSKLIYAASMFLCLSLIKCSVTFAGNLNHFVRSSKGLHSGMLLLTNIRNRKEWLAMTNALAQYTEVLNTTVKSLLKAGPLALDFTHVGFSLNHKYQTRVKMSGCVPRLPHCTINKHCKKAFMYVCQ